MKNPIFLGLFFSILFLCSCKDRDLKCNTDTLHPVEADENSEAFIGKARYDRGRADDTINGGTMDVENKKSFSFSQYGGPYCVLKKQIIILNIPTLIGDTVFLEPRLPGFEGEIIEAIYAAMDDDAVKAFYYILPPENFSSWFLIECIEEEVAISGQFQLGFEVREGFSKQNLESFNLPDTIILTNGVFDARNLD